MQIYAQKRKVYYNRTSAQKTTCSYIKGFVLVFYNDKIHKHGLCIGMDINS